MGYGGRERFWWVNFKPLTNSWYLPAPHPPQSLQKNIPILHSGEVRTTILSTGSKRHRIDRPSSVLVLARDCDSSSWFYSTAGIKTCYLETNFDEYQIAPVSEFLPRATSPLPHKVPSVRNSQLFIKLWICVLGLLSTAQHDITQHKYPPSPPTAASLCRGGCTGWRWWEGRRKWASPRTLWN